ncbi:MAG: hypothetical protein FWD40_03135 [Treponema sp.]|nr:hypothetical protein [Treponema sp.]
MKKTLLILLICFLIVPCLYANEGFEEEPLYDPFEDTPAGPLLIEDRNFEIGFNINMFVTNNYMSVGQIFSKTLVLDIDGLKDGFMLNLGVGLTPLFFNYDSKKGWGFGLSTNVDATGVLGLSGKMLSLSSAVGEKMDVSGALFASIQAKSFFPVQKFKVKVNPAMYYTIAYVKPDVSYSFLTTDAGSDLHIDYNMKVFTAFPMTDSGQIDSDFRLTGKPGFDFSVGAEYPLSREIGLTELIPFLDFDVGVDLINIPIVSSTLKNYMQIEGRIGSSEPFFVTDDFDGLVSSIGNNDYIITNGVSGGEKFSRPFKMLVSANWRPLPDYGNLLTVTPVLGFAHSDLYVKPLSAEAGLNAAINLYNMFVFAAGINYTDRIWKNSLDFIFNSRAFQLDLGIDLRSQNFLGSWTGKGMGFNIGMRFGW